MSFRGDELLLEASVLCSFSFALINPYPFSGRRIRLIQTGFPLVCLSLKGYLASVVESGLTNTEVKLPPPPSLFSESLPCPFRQRILCVFFPEVLGAGCSIADSSSRSHLGLFLIPPLFRKPPDCPQNGVLFVLFSCLSLLSSGSEALLGDEASPYRFLVGI